jgi:KDO2-lipid IV(A) lauroyltransferase
MSPAWKTAREDATAAAYVAAWRIVGRLPERSARTLFERGGEVAARRGGAGVQRLRSNLAQAVPGLSDADLDALTHLAMRSYLRYWSETFRLPRWPIADLVARTRVVNEGLFRDALASGRGVVVPLPHQANWDWAGAWACATGAPLMTVAERLRPERLFDEFVAFRESLGMTILPLTGDEPPLPKLEAFAREGGFVCLLADRDISQGRVPVTLCDAPASMPPGPAVLARSTGAALIPATLRYLGRDLEITFHDEIAVGDSEEGVVRATQDIADVFTLGIRRSPADWHMLQRVFGDRRSVGD